MGCLTRDFREKVYQQLESNARTDIRIKKAITANAPAGLVPPAPVPARPTRHRPEDRFELDEVIAMAEEIAREQNPGVAAGIFKFANRRSGCSPTNGCQDGEL